MFPTVPHKSIFFFLACIKLMTYNVNFSMHSLPFAGNVITWHTPSDPQADDGVTLSFLQLYRFIALEVRADCRI